jgi:hypothetical protein
MPGGSGLLEQMLGRWSELIATAKDLLAGCKQACDTACYSCLKTFRNQFYHPLLNRHTALELMSNFDYAPEAYREITPVFEEEKPGEGSPSNRPEARLRRLLAEHHFPEGECRKRITITGGLSTEPDWVYEPSKVAVYLDGMSKSLHGDPKTAQRDQLIRGMLELDGYTVIVVQSRDLEDPQAVRQHLKNIAQAIGRTDLVFEAGNTGPPEASVAEAPLASKYGFKIEDWDSAKAEMKDLLIQRAKLRGTMPYSELTNRVQTISLEPHSQALAAMLGEVSEEEDAAGRGLLTVIVVHKDGEMQPGPGFFELAKLRGRDTRDILKCWIDELKKVHGVWSNALGRKS